MWHSPFARRRARSNSADAQNGACVSLLLQRTYALAEKLESSDFTKVYKAYEKSRKNPEPVVIKFAQASEEDDRRDALWQEYRMLCRVQHRNCLRAVSFHDWPGASCALVTEHIDGVDLLQHVQTRGRVPEPDARTLFRQMVDVLVYVHSLNIAHRDLKLENFLLHRKTGRVVLIDFGFAKHAHARFMHRTPCGSPRFVAPEVIDAKKPYNGMLADAWSLGVCLWCLLDAQFPWPGDSDTQQLRHIMRGDFGPPKKAFSANAQDLLDRLLTVDVQTRMQVWQIPYHAWMTTTSEQQPPGDTDSFTRHDDLLSRVCERCGVEDRDSVLSELECSTSVPHVVYHSLVQFERQQARVRRVCSDTTSEATAQKVQVDSVRRVLSS